MRLIKKLKERRFLIILTILIIFFIFPTLRFRQNLVANPEFKTDNNQNQIPDNWYVTAKGQADCQLILVEKGAKITNHSQEPNSACVLSQVNIAAPAQEVIYYLSAQIKTEKPEQPYRLYTEWLNKDQTWGPGAGGSKSIWRYGTGQWETIKIAFQLSSSSDKQIAVHLWTRSEGVSFNKVNIHQASFWDIILNTIGAFKKTVQQYPIQIALVFLLLALLIFVLIHKEKLNPIFILIILVISIWLSYASTLHISFLADDLWILPYYSGKLSLIEWIKYFSAGEAGVPGPYRPIVMITWALDKFFWQTNPLGFHLTNLLFHLANAFCLYWLTYCLTKKQKMSLAAGIIFAIHPIHPASVTWIAGRTDLICAFWLLLCFIFFHHFLSKSAKNKGYYYLLTLLMFALALFSKEVAIMLLPLLIIYKTIFGHKAKGLWVKLKTNLRLWSPFLLVFVGYILLRFRAFGRFGYWGQNYKKLLDFRIIINILIEYSRMLLTPFLPLNIPQKIFLPLFLIILALIIFRFRSKLLYFTLALTILTLIPTLQIGINEKFLYIPSLGFSLGLALILLAKPLNAGHFKRCFLVTTLIISLLLIYFVLLIENNALWQKAGQIVKIISQQTKNISPELIPGSRLLFSGDFPDFIYDQERHALVFPHAHGEIPALMSLIYPANKNLSYEYITKNTIVNILAPDQLFQYINGKMVLVSNTNSQ